MNKSTKVCTSLITLLSAISMPVFAGQEAVQDMSDPLAVYSQFGAGVTNKGLNLKYGQSYDTGNPNTIVEKQLAGSCLNYWRYGLNFYHALMQRIPVISLSLHFSYFLP